MLTGASFSSECHCLPNYCTEMARLLTDLQKIQLEKYVELYDCMCERGLANMQRHGGLYILRTYIQRSLLSRCALLLNGCILSREDVVREKQSFLQEIEALKKYVFITGHCMFAFCLGPLYAHDAPV